MKKSQDNNNYVDFLTFYESIFSKIKYIILD